MASRTAPAYGVCRVALFTLVASGLVGLTACEQESAREEPGPLARRILASRPDQWRVFEVPGVRMYAATASAADSSRSAIGDSVSTVRSELLSLLDVSRSDTARIAHVFLVGSRDDMRQLTGAPLAGFVQQNEPTAVLMYARGYGTTQLMRHELAHLYAFQHWGQPSAGRWLIEGIAAWAAGRCQGNTNDALSAGALARGVLVPLARLATTFETVSEDVALPMAGSIVEFVHRRGGVSALRTLWNRPSTNGHPLGPEGPEIEREWLRHISAVRPAHLDIQRVMREGC